MKITKALPRSQISIEFRAKDKKEAIQSLVEIMVEQGRIPKEKREEVTTALLEREELTSTGLGHGVALPHVKTNVVKEICIAFGRSAEGIDFDALDGNPVHFFFLILAPPNKTEEYLKTLSSISTLMKNEKVRSKLYAAKSADEIFRALDQSNS
jgi:fructose-specific phosphotransferase system IIA component